MRSTKYGLIASLHLLLIIATLSFATVANAQTTSPQKVNYSWTAPTVREDGTALTTAELSGYEITTVVDGGAPIVTPVATGSATAASVALNLQPRVTPYMVVSSMVAIDTASRRSKPCAAVTTSVTVVQANPSAPTNFKVTVVCTTGACNLLIQ